MFNEEIGYQPPFEFKAFVEDKKGVRRLNPEIVATKLREHLETHQVPLIGAVREGIVSAYEHRNPIQADGNPDPEHIPLRDIVSTLMIATNPSRPADINGLFVIAKALNLTASNACAVLAEFSNTKGAYWQDADTDKEFENLADFLGIPRGKLSRQERLKHIKKVA
jgi:hypothetical protein